MNRPTLAIATLTISILSGCSGAAPAPIPTSTRAPTPSPAPTASPAVRPAPSLSPPGARELPPDAMEPGTYFGEFEGTRYTFSIPDAEWNNYPENGCCTIFTGGDTDGAIIFFEGDYTSLYARACHSAGTEFEFGPTVDDLANALLSLQDFEVSEPTDVVLSGFLGKRVRLTVPMDVDVTDSDCYEGNYSLFPGRHYQAAGQTDDIWILDVNGDRMVPTFATTQDTTADVLEQVEQIRNSLVIEPL
jgi:hypothetical protein